MPELPDVEVFRQYVEENSIGCKVAAVHAPLTGILKDTSPQALGRSLGGLELTATRRHGKYLAIFAGGKGCLVLHFGMTGFLQHLQKKQQEPQHVRLRLDFQDGQALVYDCSRKLGSVRWQRSFPAFLQRKGLGPDALEASQHEFFSLMHKRKGSVKTALMRQQVLAGIGNVYSDEILFKARMHPRTRLAQLASESLQKLHSIMHTVLQTAIDKGAAPEQFPRSWLLRAMSEDKGCPICGGEIVRENIGGRNAHLCPMCQN